MAEPSNETTYQHQDFSKPIDVFDMWSLVNGMGSEVTGERIFDYNGRKIILLEYSLHLPQASQHYFIVPGFIVGELRKYDKDTKQSGVKETGVSLVAVVDDCFKDEVKQAIKDQGFDSCKEVVFW